MQLEAENWRLRSTTLVHGVFAELDKENWRLCSTTVLRGAEYLWSGVFGELDKENWRLCSGNCTSRSICGAGW